MAEPLNFRDATPADAPAIAAIYAYYVRETSITFEVDVPDVAEMERRIATIMARYPYLVAERDDVLIGYAYATELYGRAAYRWVAETTIYLAPEHHGRGAGRALYQRLIAAMTEQGFKGAVGKITLPNAPSTGLHEALGFRLCGRFDKVGYKLGRWYDVGLYQLDLGDRPESPAEPYPAA